MGTPRQGTLPGRVLSLPGPGRVPPLGVCPMEFWVMLQSIMGYGYPPRCLPHGILGNVAKHYGIWVPPPVDRQKDRHMSKHYLPIVLCTRAVNILIFLLTKKRRENGKSIGKRLGKHREFSINWSVATLYIYLGAVGIGQMSYAQEECQLFKLSSVECISLAWSWWRVNESLRWTCVPDFLATKERVVTTQRLMHIMGLVSHFCDLKKQITYPIEWPQKWGDAHKILFLFDGTKRNCRVWGEGWGGTV